VIDYFNNFYEYYLMNIMIIVFFYYDVLKKEII